MNKQHKEVIELLFSYAPDKYNSYLIRKVSGILGISEEKLLTELNITRTEI
jgi:hypothetical protein